MCSKDYSPQPHQQDMLPDLGIVVSLMREMVSQCSFNFHFSNNGNKLPVVSCFLSVESHLQMCVRKQSLVIFTYVCFAFLWM